MRVSWLILALAGAVAACGQSGGASKDNPFRPDPAEEETPARAVEVDQPAVDPNDEDGDGVIDDDVPVNEDGEPLDVSDITRNLTSAVLSTDGNTLAVIANGIAGAAQPVIFARNAAIEDEVPGYLAFSYQDDPLDRMFIALSNRSPDGSVSASTVVGGGQFTEYFPGGQFARVGAYDPVETPSGGQVEYAGEYAGIMNVGSIDGANLDRTGWTTDPVTGFPIDQNGDIVPTATVPRENWRVTGTIFINANFVTDEVAGSITNREAEIDRLDTTRVRKVTDLNDIALILTPIEDDGTFLGNLRDAQTDSNVGSYAGIFGGTNSSSIAGITEITKLAGEGAQVDPADPNQTQLLTTTDAQGNVIPQVFIPFEEAGVFVLTQCDGGANPSPFCDVVD